MLDQQVIPAAINQFRDLESKFMLIPIKDHTSPEEEILSFFIAENINLAQITAKIHEIKYFQSQLELP